MSNSSTKAPNSVYIAESTKNGIQWTAIHSSSAKRMLLIKRRDISSNVVITKEAFWNPVLQSWHRMKWDNDKRRFVRIWFPSFPEVPQDLMVRMEDFMFNVRY